MADWNPSTPYSPGAQVTFLGLTYVRSQYPPTPTSGTNPKEEMSVDPKGDPIRSWELRVPSGKVVAPTYHVGYFSLKAAERSDGTYVKIPPLPSYPGKLAPEHPYAGSSEIQQSAYGPTTFLTTGNVVTPEVVGESREMDQERSAAGPIPSAPVMPAAKCGVAMQQFQETFTPEPVPPEPYLNASTAYASSGIFIFENLTFNPITETWYEDLSARPRTFYVFLSHNHPLYFRRQHTITFRLSTYTYNTGYEIPGDPPVVVPATAEGVYSSTTQTVTPTDNNFFSGQVADYEDYFKPVNAVATYVIPDDTTSEGPYGSVDGVDYALAEAFISDIEAND